MKFTLLVAAFAAVVSAVTPPDVSQAPSGNPIMTPGLDQQVPVGKPFPITWQPTTHGRVSILLLRGPSTNVRPISVIAESIENTGSFSWTPPTDLENDHTHYGIQIIVEGTGQYQYSTQFGVENHHKPSKPSKPSEPAKPTEKPTWTGNQPTAPATHIVVPSSMPTGSVITLTTSVCPPSQTPGAPQPTGGYPVPVPSGSGIPVPPSSPSVTPPPFNNGAGRVGAGVGAALLAVAAAFAL
ncbi:hypothetical protein MferCBS31731_007707 [Microsporum ferrugineum]